MYWRFEDATVDKVQGSVNPYALAVVDDLGECRMTVGRACVKAAHQGGGDGVRTCCLRVRWVEPPRHLQ